MGGKDYLWNTGKNLIFSTNPKLIGGAIQYGIHVKAGGGRPFSCDLPRSGRLVKQGPKLFSGTSGGVV